MQCQGIWVFSINKWRDLGSIYIAAKRKMEANPVIVKGGEVRPPSTLLYTESDCGVKSRNELVLT